MGRWFGEGYWRVAADAKTMKRISFASWVSLSTIIPNRASQKKRSRKRTFFLCLKDHLQKRMYPRKIRILMHQNTLRRNAWYLLYVWPILSVLLQYRIFFAKFHSICLCSKSAYTFELECKQPSFAVLKTLNMLSCKNFHGWKNHLRVLCWNCLQFYFLENCHICYLFDQEGGSNLIRLKEAIATVWRLIWKWGRQAFLGKVFQIGVAFCEEKKIKSAKRFLVQ